MLCEWSILASQEATTQLRLRIKPVYINMLCNNASRHPEAISRRQQRPRGHLYHALQTRHRQGSTIPPGSLSIEYYTYYIVLRINTVSIMGTYLLVLLVLTY